MFKPVNIFIGFLIAVLGYVFITYGGGVSNMLTADVFRKDTKIAGDIYYTDKDGVLDIYSNFDSEPGNLGMMISWDNTKVKFDKNQIKSDYNADIKDISENMIQINIKKLQNFSIKSKLLTIKYDGEQQYINISDANMTYLSGSDMLAITKLSQ